MECRRLKIIAVCIGIAVGLTGCKGINRHNQEVFNPYHTLIEEGIDFDFYTAPEWNKILRAEAKQDVAKKVKVQSESYFVTPGERIQVYVWGEQDLSHDYIVRADGTFDMILVGEVDAGGRHLAELRAEITERLKPFLKTPYVAINIMEREHQTASETEGLSVIIFGALGQTGFLRRGGMAGRSIGLKGTSDLYGALAKAGGISPDARWEQIWVLRRRTDKKPMLIVSDMAALFKHGDVYQNFPLESSDIIFVPYRERQLGEQFEIDWDKTLKYMSGLISMDAFITHFEGR